MELPHVERRLTTILSADVVGYSRLMALDDAGTLARLKAHRKEVFEPRLAEYHGRVVKLMGDGALMEFASVVDAVGFAAEVQRKMAARNAGVPEDRRIDFRIGINIGDVIIEGDDIYGDGVNVAARLEALAEAGGICVSRTVFNHVKGKVPLRFEDLGEKEVKNIKEPVRVFKVVLDQPATEKTVPIAPAARLSRRRTWLAAGAVVVAAAAGLALWQRPWEAREEPASEANMAFPLPDKPSIAILPFTNMSGDPEQEYFADGMTDDLITDLSKVSGLFVIARNSTFVYKGQETEIRRVAEDLGVRYVVEGSVRRAGDTVRVNAQLIDSATGGHVWAERYDGSIADIFAVQDSFVRKIVEALALNLSAGEREEIARGQTTNLEAREAFQKGWNHYLRYTPADNAKAAEYLKRAVELDPEYGRAYSALSLVYASGCRWGWNEELGMSASTACLTANRYLSKAKKHASSLTMVAASHIDLYNNQHEVALTEAARAIALEPNDPEAHVAMALALITTGKPQAGLEFVETALRLNPSRPNHYVLAQGMAYFSMDNYEHATAVLGEALERDPGAVELAPLLAASYARLGRREQARAALLRWQPGANRSRLQLLAFSYNGPYNWAVRERAIQSRVVDGLYVAGLPLDVTVATLAETLRQEDATKRRHAAEVLGRFGPAAAEAVPALIDTLADEDRLVQSEAVYALGKIGPAAKDAIPALTALRDDERLGNLARITLKLIAAE